MNKPSRDHFPSTAIALPDLALPLTAYSWKEHELEVTLIILKYFFTPSNLTSFLIVNEQMDHLSIYCVPFISLLRLTIG